jgi:lia operon protein LiaF
MRNRGQLFLAVFLILFGALFLLSEFFDINPWGLFWALALILLGGWMIFRTTMEKTETDVQYRFFGEVYRGSDWQAADEEHWMFVSELRYDLKDAEFPTGETRLQVTAFVGEVKISLPEDVGVKVTSTAFVTDARVLGRKRENIIFPTTITSDNYMTAERKFRLEMTCFVSDVRVSRG